MSKIFTDEEKILKDALLMMRHAAEKVNSGIRHLELAIIDAANLRQDTKFGHPLCEEIEFLDCDFRLKIPGKLDRVGIKYLWQLCALQELELRGIYNFGDKCFEAVKEALAQNGLKIGCLSRSVRANLIYRFEIWDEDPKIAQPAKNERKYE